MRSEAGMARLLLDAAGPCMGIGLSTAEAHAIIRSGDAVRPRMNRLRRAVIDVCTRTPARLDAAWLAGLNAAVVAGDGRLRGDRQLLVQTLYGTYTPPRATEADVDRILSDALEGDGDMMARGARLFCRLIRLAPFDADNEATALLAANALLLAEGDPLMLTLPTDRIDGATYQRMRNALYMLGDWRLADWLAAWALAHPAA